MYKIFWFPKVTDDFDNGVLEFEDFDAAYKQYREWKEDKYVHLEKDGKTILINYQRSI